MVSKFYSLRSELSRPRDVFPGHSGCCGFNGVRDIIATVIMENPMTGCERLDKCPMVNDSKNGTTSDYEKIKKEYCYNNYSKCARYMVLTSVGGDFVPGDLLPRQAERAKEIIDEALEWT
jgi:hypothetical protein